MTVRRSIRKGISLLLAALLLMSLVTPVFARETDSVVKGAAAGDLEITSNKALNGWNGAGVAPIRLTEGEKVGAIEVTNESSLRAAVFSGERRVVVKVMNNFNLANALVLQDDLELVLFSADGKEKTISQTAPTSQSTLTRHFEIRAGVSITMDNITLQGSVANGNGGIHVYPGNAFTLDGCGTSKINGVGGFSYGGGMRIQSAARVSVKNLVLSNSTVSQQGGGITVEDTPQVTLERVEIRGNTAPIGGGLYISGTTSAVALKNSVIDGNQTTGTGAGGGIYVTNGKINIANSVVSANKTNASGGGLYANREAEITVTESSVRGNTAHSGAGMYITPSIHKETNLLVTRSDFSDNQANLGGGAIYLLDCDATLVDSVVQNNEARMSGGGLYAWRSEVVLEGTEILNNSAAYALYPDIITSGGGIYLIEDAHVSLKADTVFAGNFAAIGGGIGVSSRSHWSYISVEAGNKAYFYGNKASYYATVLTQEDRNIHRANFPTGSLPELSTFSYQVGDQTVEQEFQFAYNNYDIAYPNSNNISYQVTYVVDGDREQVVDGNRYIQGTTATVTGDKPTDKANATFAGWSTSMTATRPTYFGGETITMNGNVTLYAVWEEVIRVSFHPNGGKGEIVTYTVKAGDSVSQPPEPYQLGYRFDGWYAQRVVPTERNEIDYRTYEGPVVDSSGRPATYGLKFSANDDIFHESVIYYARWVEDDFHIKIDQDREYVSQENQIKIALSSLRETIKIQIYEDVTLSDAMRATQLNTDVERVNVYIKSANGNQSVSIEQKADEQHFYILNASTRVYLDLQYIDLTSSGGHGGISVSLGKLHLNGNGTSSFQIDKTGVDSVVSRSAINGGAIKVIQGEVVLEGITFLKNRVNNYGGAVYVDSSAVLIKNCTFDGNEAKNGGAIAVRNTLGDFSCQVEIQGSSFMDNEAGMHGGAIYLMSSGLYGNLLVSGTSFSGNTAASSVGLPAPRYILIHVKQIKASSFSQLADGDVAAYGYNDYDISYLEDTYTVTYHANGATGGTVPVDKNRYGAEALATVKDNDGNLRRTHYDFEGWTDGEGVVVAVGDTVKLEEDLHLYAKWEPVEYVVTFTKEGGTWEKEKTVKAFGYVTPPDRADMSWLNSNEYVDHWVTDDQFEERFSFATAIVQDWNLKAVVEEYDDDSYMILFDTGEGSEVPPITLEDEDVTDGIKTLADVLDDYDMTTVREHYTYEWIMKDGNSYEDYLARSLDSLFNSSLGETTQMGGVNVNTLTLTAVWKEIAYTVIWIDDENGQMIDSKVVSVMDPVMDPNGGLNHPDEGPAPVGMVFDNWYWDRTDEERAPVQAPFWVTDAPEITKDYEIFIYAHWNPLIYTVEIWDDPSLYDEESEQEVPVLLERVHIPNGGSLLDDAGIETVEKGNYTFGGFETEEGKSWDAAWPIAGLEKNPDEDEADFVLYALFDINIYSINFYQDTRDRKPLGKMTNVRHGATFQEYPDEIPDPGTRDYYSFANWGLETGLSIEGLFTGYPIVKNWDIYGYWVYEPEVTAIFEGMPLLDQVMVFENSEVTLSALGGIDEKISASDPDLAPTYQWYYTDSLSEEGTAIPAAAGGETASLRAFTDTAGDYYYYVVMTHGGVTVTSNQLKVSVMHEVDFYTVSYELDGGDGMLFTVPSVYGIGSQVYLADASMIARSGYEFSGWSTARRNTNAIVGAGGEVIILDEELAGQAVDQTVYFYAIWNSTNTGGNNSGGGSGSGNTTLTILGYDEAEKLIYEATERHTVGKTVTVPAPIVSGYTLNDEKEKTILISMRQSENVVTFRYTTGENTAQYPEFEREQHVIYLNGYPDGSVGPDQPVTRAEVAMIFYRLVKEESRAGSYACSFQDVKAGVWYYDGVAYLSTYKVLEGYLDGNFEPDRTITRGEFAAIASRFGAMASGNHAFADVKGHWAEDYIINVLVKSWMEGYEDGVFNPNSNITRGEVATVVNRMLERKLLAADIEAGENPYNDLYEGHWAYADIMEASIPHDYQRRADGTEVWK